MAAQLKVNVGRRWDDAVKCWAVEEEPLQHLLMLLQRRCEVLGCRREAAAALADDDAASSPTEGVLTAC